MERRDGYFTRLKLRIEMLHGLNKEKVRSCFQRRPVSLRNPANPQQVLRVGCRCKAEALLKKPPLLQTLTMYRGLYMDMI